MTGPDINNQDELLKQVHIQSVIRIHQFTKRGPFDSDLSEGHWDILDRQLLKQMRTKGINFELENWWAENKEPYRDKFIKEFRTKQKEFLDRQSGSPSLS